MLGRRAVPTYVKYILGWLVFGNRNIYRSGTCSYLVCISFIFWTWRWPRKYTARLLWSDAVQQKSLGRKLGSYKALLVMRTPLNNATVTVLISLQTRSERSLSIARLGKQRYFTSIQTFTCCLISFGFRGQQKWSPFGYLYFYFGSLR
jgi:hypothetical protein